MVGLETRRYGGLEDTMGEGEGKFRQWGRAAGRGVALVLLLLLPLSPTPVTGTGKS